VNSDPHIIKHRYVTLPSCVLLVSALPHPSHMVRFLNDDGHSYDQMSVVSEFGNSEILISGWIGQPRPVAQYREVRDALFPDVRSARFERWSAAQGCWRDARLTFERR